LIKLLKQQKVLPFTDLNRGSVELAQLCLIRVIRVHPRPLFPFFLSLSKTIRLNSGFGPKLSSSPT